MSDETTAGADTFLVNAVLDGDERALAQLFDRHGPTMLRFLRRVLGPDRAVAPGAAALMARPGASGSHGLGAAQPMGDHAHLTTGTTNSAGRPRTLEARAHGAYDGAVFALIASARRGGVNP